LDINESKILSAPFVSSAGTRTIASFGTRLSIPNPKIPSQTAAFHDTSIILELTTDGSFQITGFLEEQEDKYGVNVFECDASNKRLPYVRPKSQSDVLRICIQPDEFTENDAVRVYGVTEFIIEDGQNTQQVMSNGAVQSLGDTDFGCVENGNLCFIETSIKNFFFATKQTVTASGIARLQYIRDNGRRQLINTPMHIRRRARTAGGPAGEMSFEISFAVEPSTTSYGARAYLCDQRKKELAQDEIIPKKFGDDISVCITPDQDAEAEGVLIRDIRSFVFKKNGDEQYLKKPEEVEAEESKDGEDSEQAKSKTLYDCTPGETVCAFRLVLDGVFFDGNGQPIEGEGEIELQFGSGKADWSRRAKFSLSSVSPGDERSLQNSDPNFAGFTTVFLNIPVDPMSTALPVALATQSLSFWTSMPTYGRVLILVGVALVVIASLLCGLCFVFGTDSVHFLPFDFPPFTNKQRDSKDEVDGDFTDPEERCEDTQETLKGDGGVRGRSYSRSSNGRLDSRSKSQMRSASPTKSLSSHSRSDLSVEGRMKVRSKVRLRSWSPTRDRMSKSFQSLFPLSFHGQENRESRSEQFERSTDHGKGRMKSRSPSGRKNGDSRQSCKSASAHGRIISSKECKTRKKSASSHSRNGLNCESEHQERSVQHLKSRTRSLSPTHSFQAGGSALSHETTKKKKSQGSQSLKASSVHNLSQEPPRRKKSIASSSHSRNGPVGHKNVNTSLSFSKRKLDQASRQNEEIQSSAHSLKSCSSISEASISSGSRPLKMKGRKSDTLTASSHSVQSFASSGNSIGSTDDEFDLSTDGTTEVKRGKRPTAKKGKKKKLMQSTNDIIMSLE
jgi:hypothetical protein